jgi:hypothetical protein
MQWSSPAPAVPTAPGCAACTARAASAARWDALRRSPWGPLAGAVLGAGVALISALKGGLSWPVVGAMAVTGPLVVLMGPPADVRCPDCRTACPRCGGPGDRTDMAAVRRGSRIMGAMGGIMLGLIGGGFLLLVSFMFALWGDGPGTDDVLLALSLPVIGGAGGYWLGGLDSERQRHLGRSYRCRRCLHAWRLPSPFHRAPRDP